MLHYQGVTADKVWPKSIRNGCRTRRNLLSFLGAIRLCEHRTLSLWSVIVDSHGNRFSFRHSYDYSGVCTYPNVPPGGSASVLWGYHARRELAYLNRLSAFSVIEVNDYLQMN